MEMGQTLHITTRAEWRDWLLANYRTAPDVWVVLSNKASGRPSLPYNDAVEEALCFGWIDSIVKPIDDTTRAQRYSPRRKGSGISPMNKERLRRMLAAGLVMDDVLPDVAHVPNEVFVWPDDIMAELQADPQAWAFFQSCSEPYQRLRVGYVEGARDRPDEFRKRLDNLLRKNVQGKQFGYGIESYY